MGCSTPGFPVPLLTSTLLVDIFAGHIEIILSNDPSFSLILYLLGAL